MRIRLLNSVYNTHSRHSASRGPSDAYWRSEMRTSLLLLLGLALALAPSVRAQAPTEDTGSASAPPEHKNSEIPVPREFFSLSGDRVYRVGDGVNPPRVTHDPSPGYTKAARKARLQGTVVLWLVVNRQGRPEQVRVQRSLDDGLDWNAVEAVKRWRFEPATKDGQPVAVMINVEINFKLD